MSDKNTHRTMTASNLSADTIGEEPAASPADQRIAVNLPLRIT